MKTVTIFGATGSVGQQTLDVIRPHLDKLRIRALTARHGSDALASLCLEFEPDYVVVENRAQLEKLRSKLESSNLAVTVLTSEYEGSTEPVYEADIFVTCISGAAGLSSTLRAVETGKIVLITNKEPVVMLGPLLWEKVRKHGTTVIPIDSEHNAIFQCATLENGQRYECFFPIAGLRRILLTGSGGPFRTLDIGKLNLVTPEQALAHPVWRMGPKISVDSATMMNKGLEIIEARWLFDTAADQVDVIIHPQGIVHSMVEYLDGSILAQLGSPDMRVPITNGLFWPDRLDSTAERLDVLNISALEFEPPNFDRFPCLKLAYEIAAMDGTAATAMNAANEVAVEAFLSSKIRFTDIFSTVSDCVEQIANQAIDTIETVLEVDTISRQTASQKVDQISRV